jgi:hypothetical protein
MERIKIFFAASCLFLAAVAAAATKVSTSQSFDYYIDNAGICSPTQETNCVLDVYVACTQFINTTQGTKRIYESRVLVGGIPTCQTPLYEVHP